MYARISALLVALAVACTGLAAAQETIWRITHFDAVTGLPNRAHLRAVLANMLAAARRSCRPMSTSAAVAGNLKNSERILVAAVLAVLLRT